MVEIEECKEIPEPVIGPSDTEQKSIKAQITLEDLEFFTMPYVNFDLTTCFKNESELCVAFRFLVSFKDAEEKETVLEYPNYQYQLITSKNVQFCYDLEIKRLKTWILEIEGKNPNLKFSNVRVGTDYS